MEPDDSTTPAGPSSRVAAAAIRDAIEALEDERPDIAERLAELVDGLEAQIEPPQDPPPA